MDLLTLWLLLLSQLFDTISSTSIDLATGVPIADLRYPCQFIICVHNLHELALYRNGKMKASNGAVDRAMEHCEGRHSKFADYNPAANWQHQCLKGSQGMTFFAADCDAECHTFTTDDWDQGKQGSVGLSWDAPLSNAVLGRPLDLR